MSKVEVYHCPGRGASVDDLLVDGLKSAKQLVQEGKIEDYGGSWMLPDHQDVIYFQWFPPHLEANGETRDWVSMEVNPEATDVYNREFRASGDLSKYRASRMNLADYISQHEKTKEMRENLEPGKMIVWNPLTAEPTVVGVDDRRVSDYTWQYLNEVLVPESIIPASRFKGYHKVQSD